VIGGDDAALRVVLQPGAVDVGEDLGGGAEIEDEALASSAGEIGGTAQAPRMIGAISAVPARAAGRAAGANTPRRPLASFASARDTMAIMRS